MITHLYGKQWKTFPIYRGIETTISPTICYFLISIGWLHTAHSPVCLRAYPGQQQRHHQRSASLALCAVNLHVIGRFPTQGTSDAGDFVGVIMLLDSCITYICKSTTSSNVSLQSIVSSLVCSSYQIAVNYMESCTTSDRTSAEAITSRNSNFDGFFQGPFY